MHYCLVILRNISILICLFPFIWGCGNGTEAPPKPTVVTKKIDTQKIQTDAEALTTKSKKAIEKTVVQPPSKEPKISFSEEPKQPEKTNVLLTQKHEEPLPKEPDKKKVQIAAKPKELAQKIQEQKPEQGPEKKLDKKIGILSDIPKAEVLQSKAVFPKMDNDQIEKKLTAPLSPTVQENKSLIKIFSYNPKGKIDPFEPLVKSTPKEKPVAVFMASTKTSKTVKRIPRTPLEKIDLSQLKLTGIIRAQSGNKALVEEASGKGYIITKGTYIGIHSGKVIQILNDRIIIEEEMEDGLGNITTKKVEIKIQRLTGE